MSKSNIIHWKLGFIRPHLWREHLSLSYFPVLLLQHIMHFKQLPLQFCTLMQANVKQLQMVHIYLRWCMKGKSMPDERMFTMIFQWSKFLILFFQTNAMPLGNGSLNKDQKTCPYKSIWLNLSHLSHDNRTSGQSYRADIVPNVPKVPLCGWHERQLTWTSSKSTAWEQIPNLKTIQTQKRIEYLYQGCTKDKNIYEDDFRFVSLQHVIL